MESCKTFYCIVTGVLIATSFMIAQLPYKIVNVLEETSYNLHKINIYVMRV